jgi:4-amino-4-deoxy-L-arabinose transferase-like glycosyltransferase
MVAITSPSRSRSRLSGQIRSGSMIWVSLVLEVLRARPRLVVLLAALIQALMWTLVPTLFYGAPPGDLASLLAFGREYQLGTQFGPPLAFWLGDIAHRAAGMFGVYALAQACVVATYLIVLRLGRRLVGVEQASLAVLMMVGISAFAVPTPEFNPTVLAMPLWALALLHYWRAVGERQVTAWFPMSLALGLLLLTTYWGVLLAGLLLVFTFVTGRGRASLKSLGPLLGLVVTAIVLLPHLVWLKANAALLRPILPALDSVRALESAGLAWGRLLALLVLAHSGLVLLVVLAGGWPRRGQRAPVLVREPLDAFARGFVYVVALAPVLLGTLVAALLGLSGVMAQAGLLLVPAALAIVVLAGKRFPVHRQRILSYAWFGLLLVPPLGVAAATVFLPWVGIEMNVTRPASEMGRFFAESFERRTGRPLALVAGDPQLAALVVVGAPSRPSLLLDETPALTPWTSLDEIRRKGGVVVWPATTTVGLPPPEIRARFPELTPDAPRAFDRAVQGRLAPIRVGWGVIRPAP